MSLEKKKTAIATAAKIIVLIGVKEHAALYPKRQGLLAAELGIAVLIVAIVNIKRTI